ncbi:MAG TPA: ABC transporter substrate-binding protein [Bacillota bacterium]|nr:ABC transporter substrate-binding protein [Bacillota bacterium]
MRRHLAIGILALTLALSAAAVREGGSIGRAAIQLGHPGGPLLAPLYVAVDQNLFAKEGRKVDARRFGSGTDVGYALLTGRIDAAFLEPSPSFRLLNEHEWADIRVAGVVTFPYGATVVVREDLDLRLLDLEGRTVAAGSRHCRLLQQFRHDAERLGVDTGKINFVYLEFAVMLPALEAGRVDAIVTRSSLALLAQEAGHRTLYQNWDVEPGDACCPLYLAQVEYFLLVRRLGDRDVSSLDAALRRASDRPTGELHRATLEASGFPLTMASTSPVARYSAISQELERELGRWAWTAE